jgi:hypothetical protein
VVALLELAEQPRRVLEKVSRIVVQTREQHRVIGDQRTRQPFCTGNQSGRRGACPVWPRSLRLNVKCY